MVYWPILHPLVHKELDPNEIFLWFHMVSIHSLPFFSVAINVTISKTTFIPSHGIYYMITGLLYSFVNYLGCLYRGKALYPFLPWTDYKSILFCIGLDVFSGLKY